MFCYTKTIPNDIHVIGQRDSRHPCHDYLRELLCGECGSGGFYGLVVDRGKEGNARKMSGMKENSEEREGK